MFPQKNWLGGENTAAASHQIIFAFYFGGTRTAITLSVNPKFTIVSACEIIFFVKNAYFTRRIVT